MTQQSLSILNYAFFTGVYQFCGFLLAYSLNTEVFYDVFGASNFLALGIFSYLDNITADKEHLQWFRLIGTVLFIISRSWLLVFLAWRAHNRAGDSRFDVAKKKPSLFLLFWMVQGLWVFLVSLPTLYLNMEVIDDDYMRVHNVYFYFISTMFLISIIIEIKADIQKSNWVRHGRTGGFCKIGLWKYSRHPNYFGEISTWICSFCFILPFINKSFFGISCILSPAFTIWILLFAKRTGITNAEGQNLKRYYENENIKEEYSKYRQETSILIPMPPSIYRNLSDQTKRIFLFEWDRYSYVQQDLLKN